jgi:transcriptional regulator with XRE-family HTH domain
LERLGLTHIEVAKRAKISHKSMSEWRLGKTIPNAFILQGLARAVGMELTLTKR